MLEKYGFTKMFSEEKAPTVVVGMSGGVDSSVSAAILKHQGYNVVGVFMKNWEEKIEGCCSAARDFSDVRRVAEVIGIPYYSVNFSKDYYDKVFAQFLDGLKQGFTPNPDILCNSQVKFGPFVEYANKIGAQYIATGHYARVVDGRLLKGLDPNKDQSYFLCDLSPEQLSRVVFPIGHLEKSVVREIAKELGLITAEKKDSTGICFIPPKKFRDFMKGYFGAQPGEIRTLDGELVGKHIGLMYYTIGQRKGLGIGGKDGLEDRWYVVKKDMENNLLVVNNGECEELFTKTLIATNFNWTSVTLDPLRFAAHFKCVAKTRYRQPDQACSVKVLKDGKVRVDFEKPQRAVTPGQWVVLYDGEVCLGGGQII